MARKDCKEKAEADYGLEASKVVTILDIWWNSSRKKEQRSRGRNTMCLRNSKEARLLKVSLGERGKEGGGTGREAGMGGGGMLQTQPRRTSDFTLIMMT